MKKILTHVGGNRQYRSIIRSLSTLQNSNLSVQATNLHNNIFDTMYVYKPDILIYPLIEYTQEIHNYIEHNHNKHKIMLYIDMPVENTQLMQYLRNTKCSYILKNNTAPIENNVLFFDYIYDDTIYFKLNNVIRNSKIAVSLSHDNTKNQTILEPFIYPNSADYDIVLFNNPEFKHPQNIGIYNEADLNYILNSFKYFLDIDSEFEIESAATDIVWINNSNFLETIKNKDHTNSFQDTYHQYKCSDFVNNKLRPYLGI